MSSKMFGVSPPPLGQALDSKVDLKKDFKETSSSQYKTDFEKALKEKLATKDKAKDVDVGPPKELKVQKDGSENKLAKETDKEEKDSSGGTKKRMNEKVDDQMISMIMASNESVIEIPESQNDLAPIEESQPSDQNQNLVVSGAMQAPVNNFVALTVQPQFEPAAQAVVQTQPAVSALNVDATLNAMNEVSVPAEAQLNTQTVSPQFVQQLQAMPQTELPTMPQMASENQLASEVQQIRQSYDGIQATPEKTTNDSEQFYIQPKIGPEPELMQATTPSLEEQTVPAIDNVLPKVQTPEVKMQTPQVAPIAAPILPQAEMAITAVAAAPMLASVLKTDGNGQTVKVFDLDQELNEEVGFEPEVDSGSSEVKSDEKPVSLKAQEFQKSVYEQLQKMDQRPSTAALQSQDSQNGKDVVHSEEKPANGLKAEALSPNEVHHVGQTQHEFKSQAAAPVFAGSEQHRAQILEDNHDKNIKEVMNQAEYLVKKGGGEMKISMSPDGLAEVQLKVMLQNGKVNIEMNTQDKTVKKLMEDSLTELKSGLAAQNLSVEHVKINTVTATNTDNSAQFQSNWNQSGSEQQQREYWNQFQDNLNQKQSSSRRSGYGGESSSANSMAASASDKQASVAPRTYGGTKGSQINWVA